MKTVFEQIITRKKRRFYALLAKTNQMEHKEDILAAEGVNSTNELSERQLDALIVYLDDQLNGRTHVPSIHEQPDRHFALFDRENRQHRYLLSLCQQFNWVAWDVKRNRFVADLQRLGHWIKTHSQSHKPILEQSTKELETTIYQFEEMVGKASSVTRNL